MTRFTYTEPQGSSVVIEINMKEVTLKDLKVHMDATNKVADISVAEWESASVEVLKAQAEREKNAAQLAEKLTEAGVKAAVKSAIPIP